MRQWEFEAFLNQLFDVGPSNLVNLFYLCNFENLDGNISVLFQNEGRMSYVN